MTGGSGGGGTDRHLDVPPNPPVDGSSDPSADVHVSPEPSDRHRLTVPRGQGDGRLGGLPRRRVLAGFAVAAVGLVALTLLLAGTSLSLAAVLLLYLLGVVVVALVGGLYPAVAAAVAASLLGNYYFTVPTGTLTIADRDDVVAIAVFVLVAVAVSLVVDLAARRRAEAARAAAEADVLSTLASSVLGSPDPLQAVVDHARRTFDLDLVVLEDRAGYRPSRARPDVNPPPARPESGWAALATARRPAGPAGAAVPEGNERTVQLVQPLGDRGRLVLVGPAGGRPVAADRRLLSAFTAQAAAALRTSRLRRAAEEAEALAAGNRMRTALLAAVSHDLRTPLASIKAAASSLRDPSVTFDRDDTDALLATVEESVDQLTTLVSNLLDMSRLTAGAVNPLIRPTAVAEVLEAALRSLPDQVVGQRVQPDLPADTPEILVDPGLAERAVANVVANALAYAPGPVQVTAWPAADRVEIAVVDHGPGLTEEERRTCFEPFQRLGDRGTGVGLGLAVARGFVEQLGGTVAPTTTPGGGLTMTLALPAAASAPVVPV